MSVQTILESVLTDEAYSSFDFFLSSISFGKTISKHSIMPERVSDLFFLSEKIPSQHREQALAHNRERVIDMFSNVLEKSIEMNDVFQKILKGNHRWFAIYILEKTVSEETTKKQKTQELDRRMTEKKTSNDLAFFFPGFNAQSIFAISELDSFSFYEELFFVCFHILTVKTRTEPKTLLIKLLFKKTAMRVLFYLQTKTATLSRARQSIRDILKMIEREDSFDALLSAATISELSRIVFLLSKKECFLEEQKLLQQEIEQLCSYGGLFENTNKLVVCESFFFLSKKESVVNYNPLETARLAFAELDSFMSCVKTGLFLRIAIASIEEAELFLRKKTERRWIELRECIGFTVLNPEKESDQQKLRNEFYRHKNVFSQLILKYTELILIKQKIIRTPREKLIEQTKNIFPLLFPYPLSKEDTKTCISLAIEKIEEELSQI